MTQALSNTQAVAAIMIMVAVTYLLRALPFWVFGKKGRSAPKALLYLGSVLPYTVIALLCVYCFRSLDPSNAWQMLSCGLVVALLQAWKHNNMLSIFGGTALYMLLVYLF